MFCNSIKVKNFRNIEDEEIFFDNGINILIGDNAQGKTNLIEAIYTFALGKSFKGVKEADLIRFGEDEARIELTFNTKERSEPQTLTLSLKKGRKRTCQLNGLKIEKLSEMIGIFRAVLFCPEHLALVKEGPAMRRNYLDVAVSQFRPVYLKALQRYYAILDQRNKLIKSAEENREAYDSTIDLWSAQLAHEAAQISYYRSIYVKKVGEAVKKYFYDMTGGREIVEMRYIGSAKQQEEDYLDIKRTEEKYMSLLTASKDREIYAGSTLYGIHKDDIDIFIGGKSARIFASQGQQRSLALAMKLAEASICLEETGETPVLLLDDVLSELDSGRINYLMSSVNDIQVIISTCEKADFDGVKKIFVEKGKYYVPSRG